MVIRKKIVGTQKLRLVLPLLLLGISYSSSALAGKSKVNCENVFVLSGGGSPTSNHERYYTAIEQAHEVFKGCTLSNFVTSGKEDEKVMLTHDYIRIERPAPQKPLKVKKLMTDEHGLPLLKPMVPVGGIAGAASYEDLLGAAKRALPKSKKSQGKPLVFYVTDHGVLGDAGGEIVLWNEKTLKTSELNTIINGIGQDQPLVMLFDQCYGGDMLKSLWDQNGKIRKNSCGLAAASSGQMAFSTGGVMKKLHQILVEKDAPAGISKKRKFTYKDLHDALQEEDTVRSTPVLSSDLYASVWLEKHYSDFLPTVPADHCLNMNFHNLKKSLPDLNPQTFYQAKTQWEKLKKEYHGHTNKGESLGEIRAQLKAEMKDADKKYEIFQKFLLQKYNRNIRESAEAHYKDFALYTELKNLQNAGGTLSKEQAEKLMIMQNEIDLFRSTVKDEAKLAKKHPGLSFFTKPNEKTISLVEAYDDKKKDRNDATNQMYKTQHKLSALTTMNALHKMIMDRDSEALSAYLDLLNCENTVVGEI